MRKILTSILIIAAASSAAVRGPVQGYVVDARIHAVRAINGIPGAAVLSEPLALGRSVDAGVFADAGVGVPVGVIVTEGRVAVVRDLDGQPVVEMLEGAIANVDLMAIDAAGKSAVVVSKAAAKIQFIDGLSGGAHVDAAISLGDLAARVRAVVVVDAKRATLAVGDPDGGVYLVGREGAMEMVARGSGVSALAALPRAAGLVFADQTSHQVMRTYGISGGAAVSVLASERDGVAEPVGLSVVGHRAYVVDAGNQNILAIDLDSNLPDKGIELSAVPSRAQAMDGGNTVVLTEVGDSPLLLLDTTADPKVFFVPAAAVQQQ
ncbi:MAG: hypothetical protein U0Q16_28020 [Bryobacteraceae bacterium]